MSRTFRRKNDQWAIRAYEYDYSCGYLKKIFIKINSKEYKKVKAEFHKDKKTYYRSVPSWFVNIYCEKPFRQKTKQEIIKWKKNPDRDCVVPQFIKDAGWKYY